MEARRSVRKPIPNAWMMQPGQDDRIAQRVRKEVESRAKHEENSM